MKKIRLQAHRGVSSEYPENTLAAFGAAVDEGYDIIELDPKFTKDGVCVILHDKTVTRTGRTADGGALPENLSVGDCTLAELREWDFGVWKNEKFKGEKIPTLAETLGFIAAHDIPFKFDNVWEKFTEEQQDIFLGQIKAANLGSKVGFTCRVKECFERAAKEFPDAELHWDGDSSDETLADVVKIAEGHRLTVWICCDNDASGWYKGPRASKELCDRVRKYGEIGIWILSKEEDLVRCVKDYAADAIETTGHCKPYMLEKLY